MDDRRSLERFCEATYPRLVGALSLSIRDRLLAEELAQEALLRACQRWSHVGSLESPAGWCYRVAMNLGRNAFRRRAAERRAHSQTSSAAVGFTDPDVADRVAVRAALQELTTKQRDVLVLRYYMGLSAAQTGMMLGLSEGAVRALVHRALPVLATLLTDVEAVEAGDDA